MGEHATGLYGTPAGDQSKPCVSVDEAARALGLSVDAIRKRVQRGTIPYEKDPAGRVTILLDPSSTLQDEVQDRTGPSPEQLLAAKDETIEELRARVRRLEVDLDTRTEELRRRDHLLAAALERIPAIEAPETPESPESTGDTPDTAEARSTTEERQEPTSRTQERSWWRRMFGG
jgi:seryl-tRNA synthetase